MRLEAHLDLATLASTAHVHHDEPFEVEGAFSGSGNWGYTSPDGRRFALTGISTGLSIVDVTNPQAPRNVGLIAGPESQWREVKTYGRFAYVVTEARPHGLDIVDLGDPEHPVKVRTWDQTFASAHTLWIDAERRLLFANGTRTAAGQPNGMRVLSLDPDPANPREVGSFTPFYIHDSYMRGDVLYASAINDGFLALLDVSDPGNVKERTRFFTGGRVTHNSWPTLDGRYLFTTDERGGRPLEGWDLIDPLVPRKVSEYIGQPSAIPHNVMVDGTRLLVAHYTEGVHLLDVADPTQPRLLGFYDTYDGTGTGFQGDWGAYIFPGSDLIVASDINGGLYVVRYVGR
jgi:choice-of-anchor B domain-containing protein